MARILEGYPRSEKKELTGKVEQLYYVRVKMNKAGRGRKKGRGCMRGGRAIDLQGPVEEVAGAGYDAKGMGHGRET